LLLPFQDTLAYPLITLSLLAVVVVVILVAVAEAQEVCVQLLQQLVGEVL
jgi:hypothetical protein